MTLTIRDLVIDVPSALTAIVVTALGVVAVRRWRPPMLLEAAVVPVAVLLASAVHDLPVWPHAASATAMAVALGLALASARWGADRHVRRVVPLIGAASAAGAFLTTPDTERALLLLLVTVSLVLLAPLLSPRQIARLTPGVVLAVGWVAATDGRGRPGAVVGALACIGILPFLRWVSATRLETGAVHAVAVLVASRVAGLRTSAVESGAISAIAIVAMFDLLVGWPLVMPR